MDELEQIPAATAAAPEAKPEKPAKSVKATKPAAKPKRKPAPKKKKAAVAKSVAAETAPAPVLFERPEPVKAEPKPAARMVEAKKSRAPKKSSVALVFVQLLFAAALVVGAYFGWHELSRVREESAQREASLRAQLGEQVGSVQQRFDSMVALLEAQKQKEQEKKAPVKRLDALLPLSGVTIVYPETLAGADTKNGKTTFAANPDLWVEEITDFKKEVLSCTKPLQISADGYCDNISIFGISAVERVLVDRSESSIRVLRTVSFASGKDNKVLVRLTVDLGSPVVAGRDVFAPTDPKQQEQALQTYFRSLLKKESLPEVLTENIALFDDLVAHIRLP